MLRRLLAIIALVLASAQAHAGTLTQLPFGVDRTVTPNQVCIVGTGATCLAPIGTYTGATFAFQGDGSLLTYFNPAAVRAAAVTSLPACVAGSSTAPVPTGQPFQCGGLILIAQ